MSRVLRNVDESETLIKLKGKLAVRDNERSRNRWSALSRKKMNNVYFLWLVRSCFTSLDPWTGSKQVTSSDVRPDSMIHRGELDDESCQSSRLILSHTRFRQSVIVMIGRCILRETNTTAQAREPFARGHPRH